MIEMKALEVARKWNWHFKQGVKLARAKVEVKIKPGVVVVSGMGGSAIAGNLLKDFSKVPLVVSKSSSLPHFENALYVFVSYSGNTKETLQAFQAFRRSKQFKLKNYFAITAGGKLGKLAAQKILIPSGFTSRAALPYLLGTLYGLLRSYGLMRKLKTEVKGIKAIEARAKKLAKKLAKYNLFFIYSAYPLRAVAYRWSTQIAENAKSLACWGFFPELKHSLVEASFEKIKNMAVILLATPESRAEMAKFCALTGIKPVWLLFKEWPQEQRLLRALLFGDFFSWWLGTLKGFNPELCLRLEAIRK